MRSATFTILYIFDPQVRRLPLCYFFFFFNDTATTEIYTLSLHDALPIFEVRLSNWKRRSSSRSVKTTLRQRSATSSSTNRSEEHTSELQSHLNLVCRLLLEKKKKNKMLDGS